MKIQIRNSIFETNSSSTHCLILMKDRREIFPSIYSYNEDMDDNETDKMYELQAMGDEPGGKNIINTAKKQIAEYNSNLHFEKIDDEGNIVCKNIETGEEEVFTFYIYEYMN